ncbi:MAG: YegS/Rv2252/BmrU family lipid kinase [Clostridia bacterium]|jgi:YegS/Rv2252/BmrU family lipid kinase|nr:YegS/Rv2252/BmrU family lipid kinase [Clostridia bacterium]
MAAHRIFFIVNPKAACGRALGWWQNFLPVLPQIHSQTDWAYTYARFSAIEQVEAAIKQGYDTVVSIGGDGTAMEVLNGIIKSGEASRIVMVPWPVGTGCDFARMLYQDTACKTLIDLLNKGSERAIDIMEARYTSADGGAAKLFLLNMCNLGIAALTSNMINRISVKSIGKPAFVYSALKVISSYKGVELVISLNGTPLPKQKYAVACFGNGGYIGGGMHACPKAEIDDGFIDILLAVNMSKAKVFSFLPKFMRGNHLSLNGITYSKGQYLTVDSSVPQLLDLDGEQPGFTPLQLSIMPKAIKILSLEEKAAQVLQNK